ncbi:MAG: efflux RND transporter permease subunit [Bacteroidales bacterium]|jgi:hydrophobe/amphiphile efflux-3 (HAE3) family protein|nr:efflux RND transporter permease subunit [Bacteroidales bacterium]MDY0086418.1 efflux RND transporter permease subunit [Bacteroidales bacterium]
MWTILTRFILRNRLANLIVIVLFTALMGWLGTRVQMSYEMARMLPETDSTIIIYENFKKQFGEDGSVMFVGLQDEKLFELDHFQAWYDLTNEVRNIEGVEEAISVARMFQLVRNDSLKKFDFVPVIDAKPQSQAEMDSLKNQIFQLPFYEGRLFNSETHVSMMMITLDKNVLNTKNRVALIHEIESTLNKFSEQYDIRLYYSGMPYIRTITSEKIQQELVMFVFLSLLIAAIILFAFFRSFRAVFFIIVIVLITVVVMFGTLSIFGFKITILTGILPPLLIVIGVENSIFLLNKYYNEFSIHGNKIKALSRVIRRIGAANLLTNATTAAGFAAFTITGNALLVEFGIIASINILLAYLVSLFLIPIIFSYLPNPKPQHIQHFEKGNVNKLLQKIAWVILNRRNVVYIITVIAVIAGVLGVVRLRTTGNMVDDISHKSRLYKDLMFFEKHFKGVMPFEISIDTKKKKGLLRASTLQKLETLQDSMAFYPELSKPVSMVEVVKFSKQAFFKGNPAYYELPTNQERNFILSYVPNLGTADSKSIINAFVDSSLQKTRISVQMANIGTTEIDTLQKKLKPTIDEIFPPEDFDVDITGGSIVFLEGTNYLVKNLISSLLLALLVIAVLMALTFSSFKMVIISLIPNLIPQLLTAAMMGYAGISIKPSTILIFSIALGISVDNTIHFLARYRLQLFLNDWKIKESVLAALLETGFSMIYSAVVLFFGFAIFILSSFGGTEALGYLVSFTLLAAMLSNLFVLPSLLLTLDKRITTKAFREPLIEILDEEDDIELDDLEIEGDEETKKE